MPILGDFFFAFFLGLFRPFFWCNVNRPKVKIHSSCLFFAKPSLYSVFIFRKFFFDFFKAVSTIRPVDYSTTILQSTIRLYSTEPVKNVIVYLKYGVWKLKTNYTCCNYMANEVNSRNKPKELFTSLKTSGISKQGPKDHWHLQARAYRT